MENYWFVCQTRRAGASLIAEISPAGSRVGKPTRFIAIDESSNSWFGADVAGLYLFEIDGELLSSQIMEDGKVGIEVVVA